eukprot:TRINITY_DN2017_c1_g1_i2.p1 TRINITY_DN2017_c1_g1~~TRINITY_DN2017_c1_g1_i2.p1  ORF type:complete len:520 (-),score=124.04 TRINITY_DN2017_c1_g1_i2:1149-2708(-)
MFFYRPWVHTPSDDDLFDKPVDFMNIYRYNRQSWGYGVLLGLTIIGSLALNASFLMSFWTWPTQRRHVPSVILLMFSIRDILVTLFLMPTMISWLIVEEGKWTAGSIWCTGAGFLDFFLAAEYPFLILCLSIVLITRKITRYYDDFFDPALDEEDDHRKVDEYIQSIPTVPGVTVVGPHHDSRAPSIAHAPLHSKFPSSPPSIAGFSDSSRSKRRLTPGGGFHTANKAASISGGSIRPSNYLKPPLQSFRASSPLQEEVASVDLWEEASLGYPGKQCPSIRNHGQEVDFEDEENGQLGPPTFHGWHYYLAGCTWVIALSFGISAAFYMRHFENTKVCMLYAKPLSNYNVLMDPGYNYLFSVVILTYLVPMATFLVLCVFLYQQRTKDDKFRRYIKLLLSVFVVFVISRTPIDQLQLEGIIDVFINDTKRLSELPYELEQEIILIWASFIPTFLHPIIFMGFISEYRSGACIGWKIIGGCYNSKKNKNRGDPRRREEAGRREELEKEPIDESMTKESEFL